MFYVADDASCHFSGNAYSFTDIPGQGTVVEPGISFFDREEQAIDRLATSFARSLVAAMLEAF